MATHCCSAHRCGSVTCSSCAWRYALRVSRRIQAVQPRQLHAVTIGCSASDPLEFLHERKSLHNLIAYQRQRSSWWRSTGFWGWWGGLDLRGIVSLGSVTATEFMIGLRRHGDVCLGPIEIENIRTEVYAAAMSIPVAPGPQGTGRYQPFKIAIEPVGIAARSKPIIGNIVIEPLPIIF